MKSRLVSVVVPTLNRARYLGAAIESVFRQTWQDWELIVADNGSTDDTADVVARFGPRARFTREARKQCIGAARNAGVALATGPFLAFLDDDDLWIEDKLEVQMRALEASPELDAVYGHMEQFASPELDDAARARFRRLDGQVIPSPLPTSLLIRREAYDRVGPFDESLQVGVDVDWYSRLCDAGLKSIMLDAVVFRRRLHSSNTNVKLPHEQSERLLVLKRMIDRRRAAAARPV